MRRGKGNQKGSAFEREICRALSRWLTDGMRDDCFWRSATSGARATFAHRRGRVNRSQVGDISSIDPMGEWLMSTFVIECKHLKDLGVGPAILRATGPLVPIWEKVCDEARRQSKYPMLVARQNRFPTILATTPSGSRELGANAIRIAFLPKINMDIFPFEDVCHLAIPDRHIKEVALRRPRLHR